MKILHVLMGPLPDISGYAIRSQEILVAQQKLGKAGRAYVATKHTWVNNAATIVEVLERQRRDKHRIAIVG